MLLALTAAVAADRLMLRRRLLPKLFESAGPEGGSTSLLLPRVRRLAATGVLFLVFWIAVFSPLGSLGSGQTIDVDRLRTPQLFLVHVLLIMSMAAWYACGFVGGSGARTSWSEQFGLRTQQPFAELGLGVVAGLVTWLLVLVLLIGVGVAMWLLGGADALPQEAPAIIPWIAALPVVLRLALSASAGFFEEFFFRGFLQPRIGVGFSTALFVLAHASYEQPIMLLGVTALSLIFAFLVRWRQSIWAAVVAHAVFDAVQLVFVIPVALRFAEAAP